jgi:ATP-dependent RNA helicase RhlE
LPVIIGTDALSRGIDVEGIDLVVNYDVPGDPEDYVHRIGRTARAATTGTAITFVNNRDLKRLKSIEDLIEKPIALKELPEVLQSIEAPPREDRPHGSASGQRRDGKRNPKRLEIKNHRARLQIKPCNNYVVYLFCIVNALHLHKPIK